MWCTVWVASCWHQFHQVTPLRRGNFTKAQLRLRSSKRRVSSSPKSKEPRTTFNFHFLHANDPRLNHVFVPHLQPILIHFSGLFCFMFPPICGSQVSILNFSAMLSATACNSESCSTFPVPVRKEMLPRSSAVCFQLRPASRHCSRRCPHQRSFGGLWRSSSVPWICQKEAWKKYQNRLQALLIS